MTLAFWLSVGSFVIVAGVCAEVAAGWRKIPQLRDTAPAAGGKPPKVSIIVSALNEADTIAPALRSLLSIDYPNLEIIAIDDRSTDATPAIIDRIAAENAADNAAAKPALSVVHLRELPPRWLGKNHALYRGAQIAGGDYLLFTDADAVFAPDAVSRAVAYCERHRVDHLTLFFDVIAHSDLLRMMILSFATGFMARFKPWKVNDSPRHFVGVGGFNMVRSSAYADVGGHAAMPLAVLDDMMLGKLMKTHGHRQHALFGTGMVAIEWYRSTHGLIHGMEKNMFSAFDYRVRNLLAATLLILVTRLWPWVALLVTGGATWWINLANICAAQALAIDMLHVRKWSYRCLIYAPVVPLVELAMWWRSCLLVLARGGIEWRGTRYSLRELRRAHEM